MQKLNVCIGLEINWELGLTTFGFGGTYLYCHCRCRHPLPSSMHGWPRGPPDLVKPKPAAIILRRIQKTLI